MGNYWEIPLAEHQRVIDVNLKGSMSASYIALRQFVVQDKGMLINIVSAESRLPTPYQDAYAASKAGLKSLGIVLRQELRVSKHKNIVVISVDPWALNTPDPGQRGQSYRPCAQDGYDGPYLKSRKRRNACRSR